MSPTRFSIALGIVLLGVGVWGMATGGDPHDLVIFGVNAGHNLIHVASGALAIIAGLTSRRAASLYCLGFGAVYGLVAVAGFFNVPLLVHALNLNLADHFLHLAIAGACLWVGGSSGSA